jgi:hypothetical protein
MIFIDLEKAYDKISKNIMWWVLERKKKSIKYVILINDIFTNVVSGIKIYDDESNIFSIKIRLHQGLALVYIFSL